MNILLSKFAYNAFIDEMLFWSSEARRVVSVKAVVPTEGKCRIEATFEDGTVDSVEHMRGEFEAQWNESRTLIGAITSIQDDLSPLTTDQVASLEADRQEWNKQLMAGLAQEVVGVRQSCNADLDALFKSGDYGTFMERVGIPYGDMSASLLKKIEYARKHTK